MVFFPSLVPLCPAGPQTPGKSHLTSLSVCLCHPHPLLSIPLCLFHLGKQHSKQLLPLPQLSEVHRHKGQEGQLQPSALTSCLSTSQGISPSNSCLQPHLLFELESSTEMGPVAMCLGLRSRCSHVGLSAEVFAVGYFLCVFSACYELGQV